MDKFYVIVVCMLAAGSTVGFQLPYSLTNPIVSQNTDMEMGVSNDTMAGNPENEAPTNADVTTSTSTGPPVFATEASSGLKTSSSTGSMPTDSGTEASSNINTTPASSTSTTSGSESEAATVSNTKSVVNGSMPNNSEVETSSALNLPLIPGTEASGFVTETTHSINAISGSTGQVTTEAQTDVTTPYVGTVSVTSSPKTVTSSGVTLTTGNTEQTTTDSKTEASTDINTKSISRGTENVGPENVVDMSVSTTFVTPSSVSKSSQSTTMQDVSNNIAHSESTTIGSQANQEVLNGNTTSGRTTESLHNLPNNSISDVMTSSSVVVNNANTTSGGTGAGTVGTEVLDNVLSCARFPTRMVDDTLLVTYIDIECEMEVTVSTVDVRPQTILQLFNKGNKVTRRPSVRFRAVPKEENDKAVICKPLPTKDLDRGVAVEVVKGQCHMVLKVKKVTQETVSPSVQDKTTDEELQTKQNLSKTKYIPVLEYLDDDLPKDVPEIR